jgi:hypothetical protein
MKIELRNIKGDEVDDVPTMTHPINQIAQRSTNYQTKDQLIPQASCIDIPYVEIRDHPNGSCY